MGYIYMADVVTDEGRKGIKVGKAKDGRLDGRLADHARDIQWASFKVLKTWHVRDEDTTETALLDSLKLRARPIHGQETFCHSINPVRITRRFMGDSMAGGVAGWLFWECDKFYYQTEAMNRGIDGRSLRRGDVQVFVSLWNLVLLSVMATMLVVGVAAWIVERLLLPAINWISRMTIYVVAYFIEEMQDTPQPPPVPKASTYARTNADYPTANPMTN